MESSDPRPGEPPGRRRSPNPADRAALVLALALALAVFLIGLAIVINVAQGHNPNPTLGENTTQVLTATIGGIIGILGSYLGRRGRDGD
jgi:hypothetical protein